MYLEDIAQINIGIVLKRKEAIYKSSDSIEYKIFNIKSYEDNIEYEKFYSEEHLDNYIAKKGDLLIRLAFPLKIIKVDKEINGLLINNQYCIVRIDDLKQLSYDTDFIKWILESKNVKNQLEKYLIGTSVKTIPVSKLKKIKIPNIKKEEQEKISKLIYNWNKQKQLYNQMIIEKDNYYNSIINKVINGGNK